MAESKTDNPEGGKKLPLKQILVVGGLLALEAALILGVVTFLGSDPEVARAIGPDLDPALVEQDKIVEIQVLDAKLPNARAGISFIYPTEVYVQVKNRHSAVISDTIDQFYNEIKAEITAIWRNSEPQHFQEPKLETLNRKVHALIGDRFGEDSETGKPIVSKIVIVMGTGFRVDT